ncbi:helix-turn-helix transcriptional regulator [Larkinella humicola]|uniref:Helix-turn-helix transcriptional regulator n=1 Tax=Larkinella humicola TaxID=2607654 RepID=A0A5N1J1R5_9BACT|nr:helix-turn-helix domain-containing protein [Larkinella humicola]KAA9340364.1 helix-turn-helix transcriptional regulator [Larkinella humicola]
MVILQTGNYSGQILDPRQADGLLIGRTVYQPQTAQSPWHYHQNAHISFLLQGRCQEQKQPGVSIHRTAGDIVFMHAGQAHQITTTVFPSQNLNVEISRAFLSRFDLQESTCNQTLATHPFARVLLVNLYREWTRQDALDPACAMLLLDLIGSSPDTFSARQPTWMRLAEQRLRDQWQIPPTLAELASLAQVHPVTLSKGFHKYKGCTLGTYLRRLKIEQAIGLIHTAKNSLSEIAFLCGFADQSHFIRTFRELTGLLPSAYKKW